LGRSSMLKVKEVRVKGRIQALRKKKKKKSVDGVRVCHWEKHAQGIGKKGGGGDRHETQ